MSLEYFQQSKFHHFSRKPIAVLHWSHGEHYFSYIQREFHLKQLMPAASCPVNMIAREGSMSIFLFNYFLSNERLSLDSPRALCTLNKHSFSNLSSYVMFSSPLIILVALLCWTLQFFNVSLELEDQHWTQYSRCSLKNRNRFG